MKNLMMTLLAVGVVSSSTVASAMEFRTQDNIDYIVTVHRHADLDSCFQEICAIALDQGNGYCEVIAPLASIVIANLTSSGVEQVSQLQCVRAVEEEGTVHASPRVGRGN